MPSTENTCTFCSCNQSAEFAVTIADARIKLCSHHAALLGGDAALQIRPIHGAAPGRAARLDPIRLLGAASARPVHQQVA